MHDQDLTSPVSAADASLVSETPKRASPLPPRWLIRTIWMTHRALYAFSSGRLGLRRPTANKWGMLRLTTVGRRTGKERVAILGYLEVGADLVTPAMNGWADPEPAWWLNLQANPDATVELPDGPRHVTARAANAEERRRLWAMLVGLGSSAYTDANAARRSRETAVVILEPRRIIGPREND
jgi:deazaflavin-dependent oxidoreductase (nitroreductase family)